MEPALHPDLQPIALLLGPGAAREREGSQHEARRRQVANASIDALQAYRIKHLDMPLTPERVLAGIWEARHRRGTEPVADG